MAKKTTPKRATKKSKSDESIIDRLSQIFKKYPVDLHYISDDWDLHLEEIYNLSDKKIKEIVEFVGAASCVLSDDKLDDGIITQTRIVYFKDHEIFIKQVRIGEGYYDSKDDYAEMSGEPTEVNYWLVEPNKKGYKIIKVI